MAKELNFQDGNDVLKYQDTSATLKLYLSEDGQPFDLSRLDALTLKVGNENGYLLEKPIDLSSVSDLTSGNVNIPLDNDIMTKLVPDDYNIELWSQVNPITYSPNANSVNITVADAGLTDQQSIFPSDGNLVITVDENIKSDPFDTINAYPIDDVWEAIQEWKTETAQSISTTLSSQLLDEITHWQGDISESLKNELLKDIANDESVIQKQLHDVLTTSLDDLITQEINNLKTDTFNTIHSEMIDDVAQQITNLKPQVTSDLHSALTNELSSELQSALSTWESSTDDDLNRKLAQDIVDKTNTMQGTLSTQLTNYLQDKLNDYQTTTTNNITASITSQVTESIANQFASEDSKVRADLEAMVKGTIQTDVENILDQMQKNGDIYATKDEFTAFTNQINADLEKLDLANDIGNQIGKINSQIQSIPDIQSNVNSLNSSVASNANSIASNASSIATLTSSFNSESTSASSAIASNASSINTLESTVNNNVTSDVSSLTSQIASVSSANNTVSNQLQSSINANSSAISSNATSLASGISSNSNTISSLTALQTKTLVQKEIGINDNPNGVDMNDINDTGIYTINSPKVWPKNLPDGLSQWCTLIVVHDDVDRRLQIIYSAYGDWKIHFRQNNNAWQTFATGDDIDTLNQKILNKYDVIYQNASSLDDLSKNFPAGFYHVLGNGNITPPNSTGWGIISRFGNEDGGDCFLEFQDIWQNRKYINTHSGGTWKGWQALATANDLNTAINQVNSNVNSQLLAFEDSNIHYQRSLIPTEDLNSITSTGLYDFYGDTASNSPLSNMIIPASLTNNDFNQTTSDGIYSFINSNLQNGSFAGSPSASGVLEVANSTVGTEQIVNVNGSSYIRVGTTNSAQIASSNINGNQISINLSNAITSGSSGGVTITFPQSILLNQTTVSGSGSYGSVPQIVPAPVTSAMAPNLQSNLSQNLIFDNQQYLTVSSIGSTYPLMTIYIPFGQLASLQNYTSIAITHTSQNGSGADHFVFGSFNVSYNNTSNQISVGVTMFAGINGPGWTQYANIPNSIITNNTSANVQSALSLSGLFSIVSPTCSFNVISNGLNWSSWNQIPTTPAPIAMNRGGFWGRLVVDNRTSSLTQEYESKFIHARRFLSKGGNWSGWNIIPELRNDIVTANTLATISVTGMYNLGAQTFPDSPSTAGFAIGSSNTLEVKNIGGICTQVFYTNSGYIYSRIITSTSTSTWHQL